MPEDSGKKALHFVDVIPWTLTIITALVGIWQFTEQQSQANRHPFLEKQLDVAFDVSDTVARLATETDPAEWEKSRLAFWRFYWGRLSIVEDPAVESAMVEFGNLVPQEPVDNPKLPMKSLGPASYELAHKLRNLVLASWNVDLPPLQNSRK